MGVRRLANLLMMPTSFWEADRRKSEKERGSKQALRPALASFPIRHSYLYDTSPTAFRDFTFFVVISIDCCGSSSVYAN